MTDRTFYPDIKTEYECRDDLYVAEAEWRDTGKWVCEGEDWTIRLWPASAGTGGVDFNGHCFNRQSRRRYRACRNALVMEARDLVDQMSDQNTMTCIGCGKQKSWPDDFINRIEAECWKCYEERQNQQSLLTKLLPPYLR